MKIRTAVITELFRRHYWLLLFFVSVGYFGFWSFYKLDILPGLHGDEAWSGLKANDYIKDGVTGYAGMNNYTGIFQPLLNAFSFKLLGVGVFQLRYTTIVFNLLGIGMILFGLAKIKKLSAFIFLLLFAQSALFLTSARIAWEVNTFQLFFMGVIFLSVIKINMGVIKPPPLEKFPFATTPIVLVLSIAKSAPMVDPILCFLSISWLAFR
ncbi:hypothetical protein ACVWYG_003845 [Pedobacter sp. UYEF25]